MTEQRFLFLLGVAVAFLTTSGGYPKFGKDVILLEGGAGAWDENEVHTLSVVEVNRGGYRYWGYYGLNHYTDSVQKGKGGLAFSNDLIHWVKHPGNPIIKENCRWPCVILVDGLFHMFYAEYDANVNSRIVRATSTDGIDFRIEQVVIPRDPGLQNQNPFIFFSPLEQCYYLYYYHGNEQGPSQKEWNICVRTAKDVTEFDKASPVVLFSAPYIIAAPSMAYYNGRYYLTIEAFAPEKWNDKWVTRAFEGSSPVGEFEELGHSPVLSDNDACAFQHVFDGELYVTYSHGEFEKHYCDLRMLTTSKDLLL